MNEFLEKIKSSVEKHRDLMFEAQSKIWDEPETGFREFKTSKYLEEKFEALGYTLTKAGDIPGFYTVIDTQKEGPEVLILCELDSLICQNHPDADPERALVKSAKLQITMLHLLLSDNARRAKEVISNFVPTFKSKEEYFAYIEKIYSSGDRIVYSNDKVEIKL